MTLESIEQNARSILELYAQLRHLEKMNNSQNNNKIADMKSYINKLALNIRKLVEEEKEDVS